MIEGGRQVSHDATARDKEHVEFHGGVTFLDMCLSEDFTSTNTEFQNRIIICDRTMSLSIVAQRRTRSQPQRLAEGPKSHRKNIT